MPIHAHALVASTAKELAAELFEALMTDNATYKRFKWLADDFNLTQPTKATPTALLRQRFITFATPRLLGEARSTLAQMLAATTDAALKTTIAEALILDNYLKADRTGPVH